MNLLFLSHCYPWPLDNGTVQRVYYLVEAFTRRHRVTLIALHGGGLGIPAPDFPLREHCAEIIEIDVRTCGFPASDRFRLWAPVSARLRALVSSPLPSAAQRLISNELVTTLRRVRRTRPVDVVWAERAFFAECARRAGFTRIVADIDELETISLWRALKAAPWYQSKPVHYVELAKLYAYERRLARRFARVVVCKEQDRRFFGRDRHKVAVVPNGIGTLPAASPERETPGELLFVGSLEYEPNLDAIRYFRTRVLPEILTQSARAKFVIVGKNALPEVLALDNGRTCVVTSSVPDVTPYFETASVVVVPMRLGGGTKLKLLEALARGKAVVSTRIGAQGLDVRPGVDLEVADDPAAFAATCVRLLADAGARRRLGASGRERVLERYHWDFIAATAEQALALEPVPLTSSLHQEPSVGR